MPLSHEPGGERYALSQRGLSDAATVRRLNSGGRVVNAIGGQKQGGGQGAVIGGADGKPSSISVLYSKTGQRPHSGSNLPSEHAVRGGHAWRSLYQTPTEGNRTPYVSHGRIVGRRASSAPPDKAAHHAAAQRGRHEVLRRPDAGLQVNGIASSASRRPASADQAAGMAAAKGGAPSWRAFVRTSNGSAAGGGNGGASVVSQRALEAAMARSLKRSEALLAARNQRASGQQHQPQQPQQRGWDGTLQRGVLSGGGGGTEEEEEEDGCERRVRAGNYLAWAEGSPTGSPTATARGQPNKGAGLLHDSRLEEEIGRLGLGANGSSPTSSPGKPGSKVLTRSKSSPSRSGPSSAIMFQLESFVSASSASPRADAPAQPQPQPQQPAGGGEGGGLAVGGGARAVAALIRRTYGVQPGGGTAAQRAAAAAAIAAANPLSMDGVRVGAPAARPGSTAAAVGKAKPAATAANAGRQHASSTAAFSSTTVPATAIRQHKSQPQPQARSRSQPQPQPQPEHKPQPQAQAQARRDGGKAGQLRVARPATPPSPPSSAESSPAAPSGRSSPYEDRFPAGALLAAAAAEAASPLPAATPPAGRRLLAEAASLGAELGLGAALGEFLGAEAEVTEAMEGARVAAEGGGSGVPFAPSQFLLA
eukprot:jgi/Tetstr1/447609/TSEL_034970.t1